MPRHTLVTNDVTAVNPGFKTRITRSFDAVWSRGPTAAFRFSQFRVSMLAEDAALADTSLTLIPRQARSLGMCASLPERCG